MKIKIKNSKVPSSVPSELVEGELAINVVDGRIFYGDHTYTVKEFIPPKSSVAGKLEVARQINGSVFDGASDITTNRWGAVRNITIGNSTKQVDGSTDLTWTLEDIGVTNKDNTPSIIYEVGDKGHKTVWTLINNEPYQLTSSGTSWGIDISNNTLRYATMIDGAVEERTVSNIDSPIAPFVNRVIHIIGGGQSLAIGEWIDPLISVKPVAVNRVFAPSFGPRKDIDVTTPVYPNEIGPFIPLVGGTFYSEIPSVTIANSLAVNYKSPSDAAFLNSLHAGGARGISELNKGTVFYNNALAAIQGANDYCTNVLGLNYEVGFVSWIHGETDSNKWPGDYYNGMVQLQEDFSNDVSDILGRYVNVPFILDQISNWTGSAAYMRPVSDVPFEQLILALDMPDKFVCVGPKYWLETIPDGVHLSARESWLLGKLHGYVASKVLNGETWLPVHCTSAVRTGTKVRMKYYVPPGGNLVVDTVNVTDSGNLGLRWLDDSDSAYITDVVVNGDNTITVTLNTEPTGANQRIGVADIGAPGDRAGPTTGPRSCLRSSDPVIIEDGTKLYHWACHQMVYVTTQ